MTEDTTNKSSRGREWALFPSLAHLNPGEFRDKLEERRRLRKVRYMLFSLKTQVDKGAPLENAGGLLPGFVPFWLGEKPLYAVDPNGKKMPVPPNKTKAVHELGGFASFATVWDVDEDLNVYIRHISVWQEWNATLHRAVPIMGE